MGLPDFVIIGAMKCGTSTLAAQLAAQPGIFMTEPKEPNYFSDDPVHARGPDWYAALYDAAAPGDLKGEASTHYTKLPTWPDTVARLHAAAPEARLVYMIRNPLQRAVSHYIHAWSEGEIGGAGLDAALDRLPEIVDYGRYGMQIAPFAAAFGPDNILLTSLEALKADGPAELARIGAFLGRAATWHDDLEAQNVSARRMRRLPLQGLILDNPVARTLRRTLVPKALRNRIRQARTMPDRPQLGPAARARLEQVYRDDQAELAQVFPDHPALTACYPFAPA